jgi:hypothetical protein
MVTEQGEHLVFCRGGLVAPTELFPSSIFDALHMRPWFCWPWPHGHDFHGGGVGRGLMMLGLAFVPWCGLANVPRSWVGRVPIVFGWPGSIVLDWPGSHGVQLAMVHIAGLHMVGASHFLNVLGWWSGQLADNFFSRLLFISSCVNYAIYLRCYLFHHMSIWDLFSFWFAAKDMCKFSIFLLFFSVVCFSFRHV